MKINTFKRTKQGYIFVVVDGDKHTYSEGFVNDKVRITRFHYVGRFGKDKNELIKNIKEIERVLIKEKERRTNEKKNIKVYFKHIKEKLQWIKTCLLN